MGGMPSLLFDYREHPPVSRNATWLPRSSMSAVAALPGSPPRIDRTRVPQSFASVCRQTRVELRLTIAFSCRRCLRLRHHRSLKAQQRHPLQIVGLPPHNFAAKLLGDGHRREVVVQAKVPLFHR